MHASEPPHVVESLAGVATSETERIHQRAFLMGWAAGFEEAGGDIRADASTALDHAIEALTRSASPIRRAHARRYRFQSRTGVVPCQLPPTSP
jgi:hypothetical protein